MSIQLEDVTLGSKPAPPQILSDLCLDADLSQSFLVSLGCLAHLADPCHLRYT